MSFGGCRISPIMTTEALNSVYLYMGAHNVYYVKWYWYRPRPHAAP
ncbi:hypothetical protein AT01_421 [Yersinia aldovae 670-83]|nr:hypothetical protein AT01_421 [Yersinia aldovae 670-83]